MAANDDLLEILREVLSRRGTVSGRRMFGGLGVYFDGTFFAIIDDGVIYFRTSEETRANFLAEQSCAFSYMTTRGPAQLTSYWRLPERLLDDSDELQVWAVSAVAAARDAHVRKAQKGKG
jgi:DNA transformation protein